MKRDSLRVWSLTCDQKYLLSWDKKYLTMCDGWDCWIFYNEEAVMKHYANEIRGEVDENADIN